MFDMGIYVMGLAFLFIINTSSVVSIIHSADYDLKKERHLWGCRSYVLAEPHRLRSWSLPSVATILTVLQRYGDIPR